MSQPEQTEQVDKPVEEPTEDATDEPPAKKVKPPPPTPSWFEVDDEHNRNIYISNLPLDITEEELIKLVEKYGMIAKDAKTNKFKVKLYKDAQGNLKGDALCSYLRIESVGLALQFLDGTLCNGKELKVERAKFTQKGQYDPSKKPKKSKKDKLKEQKRIERLLSWKPDPIPGERRNCEKVIVIKNMFDPSEFARNPKLILEYRSDLRAECTEKCGNVKKVDVYDTNPEGVAVVHFNDFDSADKCVQLMNGRYFAERKLSAEHWDGKSKYKVEETEEAAAERIKEWQDFLESG